MWKTIAAFVAFLACAILSGAQAASITEAQARDLANRCLGDFAEFVYLGDFDVISSGPPYWGAHDPAHGKLNEKDLREYQVLVDSGILTISGDAPLHQRSFSNRKYFDRMVNGVSAHVSVHLKGGDTVGDILPNGEHGHVAALWGPFTTDRIYQIRSFERGVDMYLFIRGSGTFLFNPAAQKMLREPSRDARRNFELLFQQGNIGWEFLLWSLEKPSEHFDSTNFDKVLSGLFHPSVSPCKSG